jgi:hypothetical protein
LNQGQDIDFAAAVTKFIEKVQNWINSNEIKRTERSRGEQTMNTELAMQTDTKHS